MYQPSDDRYDSMSYRQVGRSGLRLPAISLGLWHNFGDNVPFDRQGEILRTAFDHGITHFDLANNYGPPAGSAESNFGRHLRKSFGGLRDELIISSKAGWNMWPGPYGSVGGSRKYLIASCDQSLKRLGLDYVDIFYHHRPDPDTPLEETVAALDHIVRSGRALYVGISSYAPAATAQVAAMLAEVGTPLLIHQPSYSMLNRWIETEGLLDTLDDIGAGCIVFSPLAQGMLTDKYLNGIPEGSRGSNSKARLAPLLTSEALGHIRVLNQIAASRGQSLAQMALAWAMRHDTVTSVLVGASRPEQLIDSLGALDNLEFGDDELAAIDEHAVEASIDLWRGARESRED